MDTYDDNGRPLTDDAGQLPEYETEDFITFPPRINRGAKGKTRERIPTYRMCFAFTGGKWEGFVAAP